MPNDIKIKCFTVALIYSTGVEYQKPLCKTDYRSLDKNEDVKVKETGSLMRETTCMACVHSKIPSHVIDQLSILECADHRKDPFE